MELRINSNATIKLDKFTVLKKVNTRITEFVCKNDTLEGKILIFGSYFQNDLDKKIDFKEIIPFTVVFKDSNYSVNDITCENFSYGEVVGRGLDCNFDVVVVYELKEQPRGETDQTVNINVTPEEQSKLDNLELEMEEIKIEELKPNDATVKEEPVLLRRPKQDEGATRLKKTDGQKETIQVLNAKVPATEVTPVAPVENTVPEEKKEEALSEANPVPNESDLALASDALETEDLSSQNELIKENITKHLDQVLQAKMEVKTDNDPTKKVKIGREKEKVTVKVIYYRNTNEIEHICHENNLSIDKVFKDNKETNFDQYRRIILK